MPSGAPSSDSADRPWGWIVCLAAVGLVVGAACLRSISAPSFWGALAAGRAILAEGLPRTDTWTFTTAGQPWIDVRWLHDLLLFLSWRAGGAGLIVLAKTGAVAAALALAARAARRQAPMTAVAAACILLVAAVAPRLDAEPAVFVMPLAAAMAAVLVDRPRPARDYAILLPVQIAWINLDVTGIVGPLVAAGSAIALWMEYRRGGLPGVPLAHIRPRLLLPAALAFACLASPYGVDHVRFILAHASEYFRPGNAALAASLTDFHRLPPIRAMLTGVLVVCAVGMIAPRQALPLQPLVLAVVALAIVINVAQGVPVFVVLVLPFLSFSLAQIATAAGRLLRRFSRSPRGIPAAATLAPVILLAGLALMVVPDHIRRSGSLSRFGLGFEETHLAPGAAAVLAGTGAPARILCLPSDGAYLAWQLPGRKVFADLREGLRPAGFNIEFSRFLAGDTAAQSNLLARWTIDGIVLNTLVRGAAHAAHRLMAGGRWSLAYFDGVTVILLQPAGDRAGWLADDTLRRQGLDRLRDDAEAYEEALRTGRRPPHPARLLGAGVAFATFGHAREAASAFDLILRGDPAMTPVHLHLGTARLAAGESGGAMEPLRRFVGAHPGSPQGWAALAQALRAGGRTNEAEEALGRAKALQAR